MISRFRLFSSQHINKRIRGFNFVTKTRFLLSNIAKLACDQSQIHNSGGAEPNSVDFGLGSGLAQLIHSAANVYNTYTSLNMSVMTHC